jgi:hypothetical protein
VEGTLGPGAGQVMLRGGDPVAEPESRRGGGDTADGGTGDVRGGDVPAERGQPQGVAAVPAAEIPGEPGTQRKAGQDRYQPNVRLAAPARIGVPVTRLPEFRAGGSHWPDPEVPGSSAISRPSLRARGTSRRRPGRSLVTRRLPASWRSEMNVPGTAVSS